MDGSCGIAIMAKASKAGLTKTRLAPCIGLDAAARLNTAFLKDAAANILQAARSAQICGYMAYGPPGEGAFFEFLPRGFGLLEAWQPSFGETLKQAFEGVLARGHVCACLINADSPTLPPSILVQAAAKLEEPGERLVLGPSTDGGYYLVGAKRLYSDCFDDIAWSTDLVFEQTLEKAASIGLEVSVLPTWYDVDDSASLAMLRDELFAGLPFGALGQLRGEARHSYDLLASMGVGASYQTSEA